MWVDRKVWDDLRNTEAYARGMAESLAKENTALHTTIDWFRVRTTQLEKERAQLLYNYVGIKVETPVYAKTPEPGIEALTAISTFDDIGDERASQLGVGWNADGTINYNR